MKNKKPLTCILIIVMTVSSIMLISCSKATNGVSPTASKVTPTSSATVTTTPTIEVTSTTSPTVIPASSATDNTPFSEHGRLSVEGTNLVDSKGEAYQLIGMSTHGIAWFPGYVNYDSFKTLRDDWNSNCVRLAMYTAENQGYCTGGDQEKIKEYVKNGVDYATQLGMYVIIDWHVLRDEDPNLYKNDATSFFDEMSKLYKDNENVIYEICNEPNTSATWDNIKSYAEDVIPVIRANDEDAVIIVGTPTWSQDIDKAVSSPLEFDNLLYALHFYAATHTDWLRQRLESCIASGLPVFVSEFGMCDSSGRGSNDFTQAELWLTLLDKYNISYTCWSLANNNETCCVISPYCVKTSDWAESDLSESGKWIRDWFRKSDH